MMRNAPPLRFLKPDCSEITHRSLTCGIPARLLHSKRVSTGPLPTSSFETYYHPTRTMDYFSVIREAATLRSSHISLGNHLLPSSPRRPIKDIKPDYEPFSSHGPNLGLFSPPVSYGPPLQHRRIHRYREYDHSRRNNLAL